MRYRNAGPRWYRGQNWVGQLDALQRACEQARENEEQRQRGAPVNGNEPMPTTPTNEEQSK